MKVAILSESSADEAAIRIFVEGLLARSTEPVEFRGLRSRGWPSVRNLFGAIYKDLWYRTDADALVVVADSDEAAIHHSSHAQPATGPKACRLCELRQVEQRVRGELRHVPSRGPLRIAIGVATPAIEAWYAVGLDPHVNEPTWVQALASRQFPYTKASLKELAYGTERPSLQLETERAIAAARRLTGRLDEVIERFPNGFGPLADAIRSWK
ncbi:MAG: hypothetical protein ACJ8GN_11150 [Longimicrobiaceae bacterium]